MGSTRLGGRGVQGVHYKGPILAREGPLEDCPLSVVDGIRSPYKVWYEDFREDKLDAEMALSGWTSTDLGGGAATVVTGIDGSLMCVIDLTVTADDGISLQYNIVNAAAATGSGHKILPEFTTAATTFDNREIFFQVRMATNSDSATDNDVKYLLGFFLTDTTILSATTGLPTVAAGGGFGFHKAELGAVTCLSTEAAITAAGTAMVPAVSELVQTPVSTDVWHTYAARVRGIDASAGTGQCDFWYDGVHRLTLETIPFDATDEYAFTIAAINGPNQIADIKIDYILTGATRPGLSYPYTDGTIY